jgi:predicted enzyme related to lactoylglutathione lyase
MERVTGIGGIFFRAKDPKALQAWYEQNLGIVPADGYVGFKWREDHAPDRQGLTLWTPFKADTTYFGPGPQGHMINYRVENLDRMVEQLRAAGVEVEVNTGDIEYGRFAWIVDPDGNRVELWEPPAESPEPTP